MFTNIGLSSPRSNNWNDAISMSLLRTSGFFFYGSSTILLSMRSSTSVAVFNGFFELLNHCEMNRPWMRLVFIMCAIDTTLAFARYHRQLPDEVFPSMKLSRNVATLLLLHVAEGSAIFFFFSAKSWLTYRILAAEIP